jgi:hypothetical protein
MNGAVDAKGLDQRLDIVRPVTQAPGGIDRLGLGATERAHVGGDEPVPSGCGREEMFVEPPRRQVAVHHHDRHSVGLTGLVHLGPETAGLDGSGADTWQQFHEYLLGRDPTE